MLAVCVHNIYSSVKLSDVFNVVSNFPGVDLFIISKASSSAAQQGVPDVEKKAFIKGLRVLYVPDIRDVNEVLEPDAHYLVVPRRVAEAEFDVDGIKSRLSKGEKIIISVSGSEATFTAKELENGTPVHIGVDGIMPPAASIAIILSRLFLET